MTMCVYCELSHPMPEWTTLVNVRKGVEMCLGNSVLE